MRGAALLVAEPGTALLDYAPDAMRLAGLDFMLVLDERGTVLSSGHFRNDYGRELPWLAELATTAGPAVIAPVADLAVAAGAIRQPVPAHEEVLVRGAADGGGQP